MLILAIIIAALPNISSCFGLLGLLQNSNTATQIENFKNIIFGNNGSAFQDELKSIQSKCHIVSNGDYEQQIQLSMDMVVSKLVRKIT